MTPPPTPPAALVGTRPSAVPTARVAAPMSCPRSRVTMASGTALKREWLSPPRRRSPPSARRRPRSSSPTRPRPRTPPRSPPPTWAPSPPPTRPPSAATGRSNFASSRAQPVLVFCSPQNPSPAGPASGTVPTPTTGKSSAQPTSREMTSPRPAPTSTSDITRRPAP